MRPPIAATRANELDHGTSVAVFTALTGATGPGASVPNYKPGHIEALRISNGEPMFTPEPIVLLDVKLDHDEGPRPEVEVRDFELCCELRRLMSRIDRIKDGKVARLEIRGGIPRRVIFESTITGDLP